MTASACITYGFEITPDSFSRRSNGEAGLDVTIEPGLYLSGGAWRAKNDTPSIHLESGTNYIQLVDGVITHNTTAFTDGKSWLYAITVTSNKVVKFEDWRFSPGVTV